MNESPVLLVVDSDSKRIKDIKRIFTSDFTVMEASDGDEAFQLLIAENSLVAIVLVDCSDKKTDRFNILTSIKNAPVLTGIPVFAMLSNPNNEDCTHALECGAVDIISIPFIETVLHSRVMNTVHSYFTRNSTHQLLLHEQEVIAEMNGALKGQQFAIYLQPVFSLSANEAVSAEALIRWIHPEKGIISPGSFIPLFEQTGFITKLDRYVWEAVCKYIRSMLDDSRQVLPISVNISRVSLRENTVCSDIVHLTDKYKIPSSLIRFEITESAYTDNPEQLLRTLADLHTAGFIILMDDFGSGYSSLNMLKDMPVDILKIDMCFLGGFETSAKAGNILTSVVRMAKWLNIPVIAEGVETKTQVEFLRSIGCDKIQGYYFSKPLPVDEYESKIKTLKADMSSEALPIMFDGSDFDTLFNGNQLTSRLFNSVIGAIGIYEFTGDNIEVIRVNDGYYDVFGYNPQSFYEDSALIISKVVEEDRELLLSACKRAIKGEQIDDISVRRILKDKTIKSISVRIRYLGGLDEHPVVCLAMSDITVKVEDEKKILAQQEALKKHNAFLQSQYDSVPCGIVRFTVEDEPKLSGFNAACKRIYGYANPQQFEEMCRESILGMIHYDDRIYFQNMINKRFYSDSAVYYEARIIKSGNSVGVISGAIDLIETPEGKTEFQTVFMDVTEEKQFESQKMLTKYSAALFTQFDQIFEFNYEKRTVTNIAAKGNTSIMAEKTMYMDRFVSGWMSRYIYPSYKEIISEFLKNLETRAVGEIHCDDIVSSIEYKCIQGCECQWNRITVIPVSQKHYLLCNVDISANKNAEILKEENVQLQIRQKEHETLETLMKNLPVGMGIFKITDKIEVLYISPKACEIYGYSHEEYMNVVKLGKKIITDIPQNEIDAFLCKVKENGSCTDEFVSKTLRRDNTVIWVRIISSTIINKEGVAINYATLFDITESREQVIKTEKQNALYKMLLEDTQPVIFDYSFEDDELNYSVLLPEKIREERTIPNYLSQITETGIIKRESCDNFKSTFMAAYGKPCVGCQDFQADFFGKGYRWYRAKYKSIADSTGRVCRLVGRATDVTDQIKYADSLKSKAETDEMTGLFNHSSAVKQINTALCNHPDLAVFFMIDIDNFKEINDTFGHPAGDLVLQKLADILKELFRINDIKARLGGDEFAVYCDSIETKEIAEKKAAEILEKVEKIPDKIGLDMVVSVSIGAAFAPTDGGDFKTLFEKADSALYQSKNSGKARLTIFSE